MLELDVDTFSVTLKSTFVESNDSSSHRRHVVVELLTVCSLCSFLVCNNVEQDRTVLSVEYAYTAVESGRQVTLQLGRALLCSVFQFILQQLSFP